MKAVKMPLTCGYVRGENLPMAEKRIQPDYKRLREILVKDIGQKYADEFTDEDIEALGDFLIGCTRACSF